LLEVEQYNENVVFQGIIDCAKAALEHDIPVVLGNDVGCPWIIQCPKKEKQSKRTRPLSLIFQNYHFSSAICLF